MSLTACPSICLFKTILIFFPLSLHPILCAQTQTYFSLPLSPSLSLFLFRKEAPAKNASPGFEIPAEKAQASPILNLAALAFVSQELHSTSRGISPPVFLVRQREGRRPLLSLKLEAYHQESSPFALPKQISIKSLLD